MTSIIFGALFGIAVPSPFFPTSKRRKRARINSLVDVTTQSHSYLSKQAVSYSSWFIVMATPDDIKTYLAQTKRLSYTLKKKSTILELTLNP